MCLDGTTVGGPARSVPRRLYVTYSDYITTLSAYCVMIVIPG